MPSLSWQQMADAVDVRLCTGILPTGHYCTLDHLEGESTPGVVHFNPTLKRAATIYHFLWLSAHALHPELHDDPVVWRRTYRRNIVITRLSRLVHVRIPASITKRDRLLVRAGLARVSNEEPLRKQAFDWSRRT